LEVIIEAESARAAERARIQLFEDEAKGVVALSEITAGGFSNRTDFGPQGNWLTPTVVHSGRVPDRFAYPGHPEEMRHDWGGAVKLRSAGTGFFVIFEDMPAEACREVLERVPRQTMQRVRLSSMAVNPGGPAADPASAAALCAEGVYVAWRFDRR
jgi:hypothetical protein